MTDLTPTPSPSQLRPLPDVYEAWRARVHGWIGAKTRPAVADTLLLLPDLLALLTRLIFDPRTPLFYKAQLVLAAVYVLIPLDFVPEAILGAAGLADDVVLVSVMLMKLLQHSSQLDEKLLQELWSGKGNIAETLKLVATNDQKLIHPRLWQIARLLLGIKPPDPTTVNSTQQPKP